MNLTEDILLLALLYFVGTSVCCSAVFVFASSQNTHQDVKMWNFGRITTLLIFLSLITLFFNLGSVLSCIKQNEPPKFYEATGDCPHRSFLRKHVCQNCRTTADALEFSKGRQDTVVNTVLLGRLNFRHDNTKIGRCTHDAVQAMKCNLQTNTCQVMGQSCVSSHDTGNGHLFYREIKC